MSPATAQEQKATPARAAPPARRPRLGLSWKLLGVTGLFVALGSLLVYAPLIAGYRTAWLSDRLATASAASVVLSAADWTDVPREIQDQLLAAVGADAIAIRDGGVSRLVAAVEMPPTVDRTTDLRGLDTAASIMEAFDTLFAGGERTIRVIGPTPAGGTIELVTHDRALRTAMFRYSAQILAVALLITLTIGAVLYLTLDRLLVRPMRRMSQAMTAFAAAPEDPSRIIRPSGRSDELGIAEEHLAIMQRDLQGTLQQQRHLADLGLAVSKINHDLRNLLASAQLFSDRIGSLPDPQVQRFAPKLIAALDRAVTYSQSTLNYGRPREAAPERRLVRLSVIVAEVAESLGLDQHATIRWENAVPPGLEVDADPDQLFRVLVNLFRNAVQALEGERDPAVVRRLCIEARRDGGVVTIRVRDTGPGVPEKARANLFRPFQGAARPGGTGLGLVISAELIRAHGGSLDLRDSDRGAVFEIMIPDRPLEFAHPGRAGTG